MLTPSPASFLTFAFAFTIAFYSSPPSPSAASLSYLKKQPWPNFKLFTTRALPLPPLPHPPTTIFSHLPPPVLLPLPLPPLPSPSLYSSTSLDSSFHAPATMGSADQRVMNRLPFDPTADVRITHTVEQRRASGADRLSAGGGLILNHYLRGPSVGKGQHGTVYKCWDLTQNSLEVVRTSILIPRLPPPPPSFVPMAMPRPTMPPFNSRLLACSTPKLSPLRTRSLRRPSRSCRATIPAPTASTSSNGSASHARGPTYPSPTTSAAKSTKLKKRSQS